LAPILPVLRRSIAVAALEAGECEGAIVAGANLIQSAEQHSGIMKAGVLSRTSTCHTFDASAEWLWSRGRHWRAILEEA